MSMTIQDSDQHEHFVEKIWLDIHYYHPFHVKRNYSKEQHNQACLWLRKRNILFIFKSSSAVRGRGHGPGKFCFRHERDALLFQLGFSDGE